MSDPVEEAAACAGKQGFASKALAEQVSGRTRRNRGATVAPYRCRFCWKWHIGSAIQKRPERQEQP